jgi:hypothetical protein
MGRSRFCSTNRATILTRSSQVLAAAALMTGPAFGSIAIASAGDNALDMDVYQTCMEDSPPKSTSAATYDCCWKAGGFPVKDEEGYWVDCAAPPAEGPAAPAGKPFTPVPQVGAEDQGPGAPIGPVPVPPGSRG